MNVLQALVLGIVQGLTEFIPVSSSGHLVLTPFFLGWKEPSLAFVVAVHVGTLGAVLWYFRERVGAVLTTLTGWRNAAEGDRRLVRFLVVATIPAVIAGIAFEAAVGKTFERPVPVLLLLAVTGYLLLTTESLTEHRETDPVEGQVSLRDQDAMVFADAATIGVAQAVAILPGISRSGATITAGMRRGLTRRSAARFSFLMSIPVIFGAVLVQIPDISNQAGRSKADALSFIVGIVASAVSGFFSIRWFLGIIERRGLRPFGVYCFFVFVAGLLTALARG